MPQSLSATGVKSLWMPAQSQEVYSSQSLYHWFVIGLRRRLMLLAVGSGGHGFALEQSLLFGQATRSEHLLDLCDRGRCLRKRHLFESQGPLHTLYSMSSPSRWCFHTLSASLSWGEFHHQRFWQDRGNRQVDHKEACFSQVRACRRCVSLA